MATNQKETETEGGSPAGGHSPTYNIELFNTLMAAHTPSEEDIARVITMKEEEQFCRRLRCRVLMYRWNPVRAYERQFRAQGRLQGKSITEINTLLSKAVNRHKDTLFVDEKEQKEVLYEEWCQRKKDNINRLRLWATKEREAAKNQAATLSTATNHVVANGAEELKKLEVIGGELNDSDASNIATAVSECQNELLEIEIVAQEDEHAEQEEDGQKGKKEMNNNSENVNGLVLNNLLLVNTESMSLGTEELENTEGVATAIAEAAAIDIPYSGPADYEDFNYCLTLTSTQSQELRPVE